MSQCQFGLGKVSDGMAGEAGHGKDCNGMVRQDRRGQYWRGMAQCGLARQAGLDVAWIGRAWRAKAGLAGY